ncbi:MAG: hypothetical protein AAF488_10060 [Planctomycetota bacterium]
MVALITRDSTARGDETPVRRVRTHLHVATRQATASREDRAHKGDLRTIMSRLRRVQARGGAFAGVELGSGAQELSRRLEVVGNDLIVLDPERKRA